MTHVRLQTVLTLPCFELRGFKQIDKKIKTSGAEGSVCSVFPGMGMFIPGGNRRKTHSEGRFFLSYGAETESELVSADVTFSLQIRETNLICINPTSN